MKPILNFLEEMFSNFKFSIILSIPQANPIAGIKFSFPDIILAN